MSRSDEPRSHWLFVKPCGCPVGLVESFPGETDTEESAWDSMYEGDAAGRQRAQRQGIALVYATHDVYVRDWYEKMLAHCSHER